MADLGSSDPRPESLPLGWFDLDLTYCPGGEASAIVDWAAVDDDAVSSGAIHGGTEAEDELPVFFVRATSVEVEVVVDDGGTPEDPEDDTTEVQRQPRLEIWRVSTNNSTAERVVREVNFGGLDGAGAVARNPWESIVVFSPDDLYDPETDEQVRASYLVEVATSTPDGIGDSLGYVRLWHLPAILE